MRKMKWIKKGISVLLALNIVLSAVPLPANAAQSDGLCEHHPVHTAACAYAAGSAGSPCTHEHCADCYAIEENGDVTMERDCHHVHGSCGYSEGTDEVPCGHVHDEDCGDAEAVEGQPCGHKHDEACGYAPATEGTSCTHVCEVKVDGGCYKLLCSHKDGGHDEACGYAPAVEAHECHYECAECAAAPASEEETDPATEPTTEPTTEPATEPEVVCTCESDDPDEHAPFCNLYAAPEHPQCLCTEQCTDDHANEWCAVCYFDPTACGASGEETAAVYALSQDSDDYYLISDADDLNAFAALVNGGKNKINGRLTGDIVFNEDLPDRIAYDELDDCMVWTPIGTSSKRYSGTFDGDGYAIIGLYCNNDSTSYVGLFGYVSSGTVKNVGVVESSFSGKDDVGGVVGYNLKGTVSGCYSTGSISNCGDFVGGVVGHNTGTVTDCYNTGSISGCSERVGGVVGYNTGTVTGCYNTGSVSSTHYAGGVAGSNSGTVTGCYNTGNVSAKNQHPGGVVGQNTGTVTGCYSTGSVSGKTDVGGVVGKNTAAVANSYYNSDNYTGSAIGSSSGTVEKVEGKPTTAFSSGEVAYLLQQDVTIGETTYSGEMWGQDLKTHTAPAFTDKKVYLITNCQNEPVGYSNTDTSGTHLYENGFCTFCDDYQSAEQVDGVYEISNAGQLYWFAQQVNGGQTAINGKLVADDIVVNTGVLEDGADTDSFRAWTPIGTFTRQYEGTFDGNGHTVSGLYFNDGSTSHVGFFGYVSGGTVKNVGVLDSSISGKDYVGGVVAINSGNITDCYSTGRISGGYYVAGVVGRNSVTGTVTGCHSTGSVTGSGDSVGGVVGENYGPVTGCYNTGSVSSTHYAGGVVGENYGPVTDCHSTGSVTGRGGSVGGVVGYSNSTVTVCYNTGSISGSSNIGGVVGYNKGTITGCYNTGRVSGNTGPVSTNYVGGVVGYNTGTGTVTGCYSTGSVSSTYYAGGVAGSNSGTVTGCYSTGSVSGRSYVRGVVGYSDGTVANCYHDSTVYTGSAISSSSGTVEKVEGKPTTAFSSGEVAYLLQQDVTIGEGEDAVTYSGEMWGQDLQTHTAPAFTDKKVYPIPNCKNEPVGYSNSPQSVGEHNYENGFCTVCDGYQSAKQVDGVYEISNAGQLYWFAQQVNGGQTAINGKLVADIEVNTGVLEDGADPTGFRAWTPIGNSWSTYDGTFDGSGHTVSGLYFQYSTREYVGLFGYIHKSTVKDVGVLDSSFSGKNYLGGVVGYNYNSTVSGCYSTGSVSGNFYVGGVVGENCNGKVTGCYSTGSVSGDTYVGGVVGRNTGTVTGCYSTGSVSGNAYVGGVVGQNTGTVTSCYSTGSVKGDSEQVGGVVGYSEGTVTGCYSTGSVKGGAYYAGGVVGRNTGTVTGCYNTGSVKGGSRVGGVVGYSEGTVTGCYSTGSVSCKTYVGGVVGNNKAAVANSYYNSDNYTGSAIGSGSGTVEKVEGKPTTAFSSGEVAYLLQQDVTIGEGEAAVTYSGEMWGQDLKTHTAPAFTDKKVYLITNCQNEPFGYSNTDASTHLYKNGFCTFCDDYQSAEQVDGVYEISNAGQLYWFAQLVNGGERTAKAKLTADIDLEGREWFTICSTSLYYKVTNYPDKGYEGTFDGNGHVISNFTVKGISGKECTSGLFGTLSGTVRNLGVDNMTFELNGATDVRAAAIAGQMIDGSLIDNCYVINSTLTPNQNIVGGVAGCNYAGTISNCYTYNVTVKANDRCGNLVSDTRGDGGTTDRPGTVINCWTDGDRVVGTQNGGKVSNCRATVPAQYFADGAVVWHLNGQSSSGIWKQGENTPGFTGTGVTALGYEEPELVDGVYQISNEDELCWFAYYVNMVDTSIDVLLVEDVDLYNTEWIPIGTESSPYTGTFDGNDLIVYLGNQTVTQSFYGMFGAVGNCTIKKVIVAAAYTIDAPVDGVAAICGWTKGNAVIEDCSAQVIMNMTENGAGSRKIGGVVGHQEGGTLMIQRCSNYGSIKANGAAECVAGILGYGQLGKIIDCVNYASVTAETAAYVSGILGYVNYDNFEGVQNCLNVGKITGGSYAGDIVGYLRKHKADSVKNNYFKGTTAFGESEYPDRNAQAEQVDSARLKSGEIAYKLGEAWGQLISKQVNPVLYGEKVFFHESIGYYNDCVNVQISWTTLEFTYVDGKWDPATHTNTGGTWSVVRNGGKLTVKNVGGKSVHAKLDFTPVIGGVRCSFDQPGGHLAINDSFESMLTVSGIPEETGFRKAPLGYVTVTVTAADVSVGEKPACLFEADTATCGHGNICTICGADDGNINSANHQDNTNEDQWTMLDDQSHSRLCSVCTQPIETAQHSIGAEGDKVATCIAKAYCSVCGEYGELDPDNHAETTFDSNGFLACCGIVYQPAVLNGDFYKISNAGQLYWFAQRVNGGETGLNARLMTNITVNGKVLDAEGNLNEGTFRAWTPIGSNSKQYAGTFDGQGHTISGLYFNNPNGKYVGLFGYVAAGGTVKNVGVVDSWFYASSDTGGIVGQNDGTIDRCWSAVTLSTESGSTGGVVGYNNGSVINCYNIGKVTALVFSGGVAGRNHGSIINCYNVGSIRPNGHGNNTGAVTGTGIKVGSATNCYYLYGCAMDGSGMYISGAGNSVQGEDKADCITYHTDFSTGEVAYLLQGQQTEHIWGQKIGVDPYPVLGGPKVVRNDNGEYVNE